MSDESNNPFEQATAFQKIWMESFTKMAQASMTFSPDSAPPELMREIRGGIFQALTQSWEEFLRSPEFMDATRKMMKNAVSFRQFKKEVFSRAQHEMEGTNRNDVDTVMLAIRHLESRLLDHMENISARLEDLEARTNGSVDSAKPRKSSAPAKNPGPSASKTKKKATSRKSRS